MNWKPNWAQRTILIIYASIMVLTWIDWYGSEKTTYRETALYYPYWQIVALISLSAIAVILAFSPRKKTLK